MDTISNRKKKLSIHVLLLLTGDISCQLFKAKTPRWDRSCSPQCLWSKMQLMHVIYRLQHIQHSGAWMCRHHEVQLLAGTQLSWLYKRDANAGRHRSTVPGQGEDIVSETAETPATTTKSKKNPPVKLTHLALVCRDLNTTFKWWGWTVWCLWACRWVSPQLCTWLEWFHLIYLTLISCHRRR